MNEFPPLNITEGTTSWGTRSGEVNIKAEGLTNLLLVTAATFLASCSSAKLGGSHGHEGRSFGRGAAFSGGHGSSGIVSTGYLGPATGGHGLVGATGIHHSGPSVTAHEPVIPIGRHVGSAVHQSPAVGHIDGQVHARGFASGGLVGGQPVIPGAVDLRYDGPGGQHNALAGIGADEAALIIKGSFDFGRDDDIKGSRASSGAFRGAHVGGFGGASDHESSEEDHGGEILVGSEYSGSVGGGSTIKGHFSEIPAGEEHSLIGGTVGSGHALSGSHLAVGHALTGGPVGGGHAVSGGHVVGSTTGAYAASGGQTGGGHALPASQVAVGHALASGSIGGGLAVAGGHAATGHALTGDLRGGQAVFGGQFGGEHAVSGGQIGGEHALTGGIGSGHAVSGGQVAGGSIAGAYATSGGQVGGGHAVSAGQIDSGYAVTVGHAGGSHAFSGPVLSSGSIAGGHAPSGDAIEGGYSTGSPFGNTHAPSGGSIGVVVSTNGIAEGFDIHGSSFEGGHSLPGSSIGAPVDAKFPIVFAQRPSGGDAFGPSHGVAANIHGAGGIHGKHGDEHVNAHDAGAAFGVGRYSGPAVAFGGGNVAEGNSAGLVPLGHRGSIVDDNAAPITVRHGSSVVGSHVAAVVAGHKPSAGVGRGPFLGSLVKGSANRHGSLGGYHGGATARVSFNFGAPLSKQTLPSKGSHAGIGIDGSGGVRSSHGAPAAGYA
ncbi:uncharacterized transmembrane protein DDB_G0289901 [Penaeus vannamei]|uniref:uncharacterized transmembrane protein DDB_G0289901 n=1 Tax=Penaeus vannamei TaxID=6689 RepID=UPI00387F596A